MIVRLPKWILVNKFPALYDTESLTAIEQTARLYGKMNELIESYNKYVDDVNKTIEDWITASDKDKETFEVAMRQEFQDFINVIDLKVRELEKYCKDNLTDTVNALWREMEQQGQVQDLINNTLAEIITTVDEFKALMSKEQSDFETEITTLFNNFKQEVTGGQTEFETQQTQRQESFETQQTQRQESFESSTSETVGSFDGRLSHLEDNSNMIGQVLFNGTSIPYGDNLDFYISELGKYKVVAVYYRYSVLGAVTVPYNGCHTICYVKQNGDGTISIVGIQPLHGAGEPIIDSDTGSLANYNLSSHCIINLRGTINEDNSVTITKSYSHQLDFGTVEVGAPYTESVRFDKDGGVVEIIGII